MLFIHIQVVNMNKVTRLFQHELIIIELLFGLIMSGYELVIIKPHIYDS